MFLGHDMRRCWTIIERWRVHDKVDFVLYVLHEINNNNTPADKIGAHEGLRGALYRKRDG